MSQLTDDINQYVRNSAIDPFQNLRLNSILLRMVTSGITDTFNTYDDLKTTIAQNKADGKDLFMRAFVKDSSYGPNRIFEYIPSENIIMWTASQPVEVLT